MKETNEHGFTLEFLDECDYDQVKKDFFEELEKIKNFRDNQKRIIIPGCQVVSPKNAYIRGTLEEIRPVYSESDGYGKFHIWKDDSKWRAGVEIEGRYILSDELTPQIKEFDDIPEYVQNIIIVLKQDLDK